jgi:hypothetical protein
MNATEILAILTMVGYAVYQQTQVREVSGHGRFKVAIIYAVVAAVVGGFAVPHGAVAFGLLVLGLVLSVVCGLVRGRLTRVWVDTDGRVLRRGTALTVGLFLGLVAAKFGIGTYEYFAGIRDAGFGDVMLMIALMVGVQAEIVWRRAKNLTDAAPAVPRRHHAVAA